LLKRKLSTWLRIFRGSKNELSKILRYGTPQNTLKLTEEFTIKGVTIEKGFESDGLTLKTRFLNLFVNRFSPKLSPFFFLHDKLCSDEKYKEADRLGREVLMEIENSFRTRWGMKLIEMYHYYKYVEYRSG